MKLLELPEKGVEIDELLGVVAELNKDKIDGKGKSKERERRGGGKGENPTRTRSNLYCTNSDCFSTKIIVITFVKVNQIKDEKQKNMDYSGSSAASSPGQNASLLEDLDNGAGSGGSAGWSDLGDGMDIQLTEAETKGGKLLDILELAKLKSRLRSLETERDQLKLTMKITQEEKEYLAKDLDRLRQELVEKERDSEQRELDRHGLTQQCSKLLQMIEEKEKRMGYSEQEREKLRTRISEAEMGLFRVEDEKRELQHRTKELEQSLKQSTELNGRLENKFYHEERRLNSKIRQLEEQLVIAKSLASPVNMSRGGLSADLNMSANSSDQGFVPLSSPDGGGARIRSAVPSLCHSLSPLLPAFAVSAHHQVTHSRHYCLHLRSARTIKSLTLATTACICGQRAPSSHSLSPLLPAFAPVPPRECHPRLNIVERGSTPTWLVQYRFKSSIADKRRACHAQNGVFYRFNSF
ncbi:hypothetical protein niasHT_036471 [Heterodera trifolii]|uniref:Uncharacterized protein n=1 Tax=Heterodera trifolii TaxID=157864 RepID=A0ABD2J199_9BILA